MKRALLSSVAVMSVFGLGAWLGTASAAVRPHAPAPMTTTGTAYSNLASAAGSTATSAGSDVDAVDPWIAGRGLEQPHFLRDDELPCLLEVGGARRILATDPERAEHAAARIRHAGSEALAEMDLLLGVLDSAPERTAQPTLDDLDGLVERTRAAGLPVTLTVTGKREETTEGTFTREFQLPDASDDDRVTVWFEHGVLEVRAPKLF